MFKNIVIPIDLSDNNSWEEIIFTALNIVDLSSGKIHIIYVIPELGINFLEDYLPNEWIEKKKVESTNSIQNLISTYIPQEIQSECYVTKGIVSQEILSYANLVNADLIITTTSQKTSEGYLPGPNAKKIIKHASNSVLLLRK